MADKKNGSAVKEAKMEQKVCPVCGMPSSGNSTLCAICKEIKTGKED